jgi:hypothetical protein
VGRDGAFVATGNVPAVVASLTGRVALDERWFEPGIDEVAS